MIASQPLKALPAGLSIFASQALGFASAPHYILPTNLSKAAFSGEKPCFL